MGRSPNDQTCRPNKNKRNDAARKHTTPYRQITVFAIHHIITLKFFFNKKQELT